MWLMFFNKRLRKIRKTFLLQKGQFDCGITCLSSILNYYNWQINPELIRLNSGTTATGVTLLGLKHCAASLDLNPICVKIGLNELIRLTCPCILHTMSEDQSPHFIVFYGLIKNGHHNSFLIGDPAKGLSCLNENELFSVWPDKVALILKPDFKALRNREINNRNWILSSIMADRYLIASSLLISIVISILGLSTALFIQKLIDNILPAGNRELLITGLVLFSSVLIARGVFMFLRQKMVLLLSLTLNRRATGAFLDKILYQHRLFYQNSNEGDFVTRITDIQKVSQIYALLLAAATDIIVLIALIACISYYSPISGYVCAAYIIISLAIMYGISENIILGHKNFSGLFSYVGKSLSAAIKNIDVIQEFSLESNVKNEIKAKFDKWQNNGKFFGDFLNRSGSQFEFAGILLLLIIFILSSYLQSTNRQTTGEFTAILTLTYGVTPLMLRLWNSFLQLSDSSVSISRLTDFLNMPLTEEGEVKAVKNERGWIKSLSIRELSFGYTDQLLLF